MSDPHRLTISVTLPSGKRYRWAPDARDTENVPSGLTFSSTVPGGFSTCNFTLPRGVIKDYPDEALFSDVRITGPGGVVAWEGRIASLPREQGSSRTLTVGAVGHAAALKDSQAFTETYVDRAMSSWNTDSPFNEKIRLAAIPWDWTSIQFQQDQNQGFMYSLGDGDVLPTNTQGGIWYSAPAGVEIAKLVYQGKENLSFGGLASRDVSFSHVDSYDATQVTTLTNDDTARSVTVTDPCRYAQLRVTSTAGGSISGKGQYVAYKNLAVYGNHGLTIRGTEPAAGFYLSDIVTDVIGRAAPGLTIGSIEQTSYVIPQAVYAMTDAESVILDANKYELKRWGVWDGKRFDMWTGSPLTRTVWEARLSDGAQLQLEGNNAESVASSVVVQYTDPYGTARVIGPTGYANADTTSDNLLITDPTNPAVAAGVPAQKTLSLSFPTDASGAEQIGAVWLREQNLPQRRGTITLSGLVNGKPAWSVRAGDFVRVSDRPSDPPREITSVQYANDSRTVSCSIGGLPQTVDAILERVGVRTIQ